mmetsp:Transcript_14318/g.39825  ORF Transcript_14318/g.39825 Transcript_14318/m.39825 type:complete len:522 (+) Transcript_14318:80-1645(+)
MTFQLSIAASGLPAASYYATVLSEGESLGKTAAATCSEEGSNLIWEQLVVVEAANVEIQVCKSDDDAVVASDSFDLAKIAGSYTKALGKDTSQGPNVAVHATEPTHDQLRLVLAAKDLPNTDFATIFNKNQKTDPFHELFNHLGQKVHISHRVENDLNPVWKEQSFSLQDLCGGSLSCPLRVTVYDKDGQGASEYIGNCALSVQQFLDGVPTPLVKGGQPIESAVIFAKQAELLPTTTVSRVTRTTLEAALTAVSNLEQLKEQAVTLQAAYQEAQTSSDAAKETAQQAEAQAETLAATQATAEAKFKETATKAKALMESPHPLQGQVVLALAASNLVDTDFGIRNKSDPLYEIQLDGTVLLQSERIEDDLNPQWSTHDLSLTAFRSLEDKVKVQILDKDGGGETTPLGYVELSVNELMAKAGGDAMTLQDQPKQSTKGALIVKAAKLQNFANTKEQAQALKEECEGPLQTALDEASAAWKAAQDKAVEARKAAAELAAAALAAQEQSEAAENAVKMAELVI